MAVNKALDRVLCIDLDGTLISTDMLWETLLSAVRIRPWVLLLAPVWLARGRAHLKRRLAEASRIDFAALPYRKDVVSYAASEHARGRQVVLATASDSIIANGVTRHLGIFTDVLASDGHTNLKGRAKASLLVTRFGSGNFDYIGDSYADVHCWESAADAISVGAMPASVAHVRRLPDTEPLRTDSFTAMIRALRPHQWIKNLLLFVPVVAAHRFDSSAAIDILVAFASWSLCASGGYVLNDLLDLPADRLHPRKQHRPLASGQLSIATGVLLIAICWPLGFGLAAWMLPSSFVVITALYLLGTSAYSIWLKREPVLDVMFLAGLYVVRVIGGGLATSVPVSTWLLAFTLFVCLSLAFLKRFIEVRAQPASGTSQIPGRGYRPADADLLQSAGVASAFVSVMILALYVNNPDVTRLYAHPDRLLLMCPVLLYWATRTWFGAIRNQIHDDPVVAVAADPVTYGLVSLSGVIILSAI